MIIKNQRTILKKVSFKSVALHSGELVNITFKPSSKNSGIVFKRIDIEGDNEIRVSHSLITDTRMCTCLEKNNIKVSTIEHLMCALAMLQIDNIIIELNNQEIPIMDGSASPFLYLLNEAGIKNLSAKKRFLKIKKQVKVEKDGKIACLTPNNSFMINYEIEFEHPFIKNTQQLKRIDFFKDDIIDEISRARTFGFTKDLEFLLENNLGKGGGTNNAIILNERDMINKESLRYKDEFVRHKILDAIGDLYVDGMQIMGTLHAFKAGHEINNILMRELFSDVENYEIITMEEKEVYVVEEKLSYNYQFSFK
jgi:UDP-3-O-[3-hydroxymyristoyl] N-acetylglucosamine deacetylase